MIENDWFNKMKEEIILLEVSTDILRKNIVILTLDNFHNSEYDINLCEKFSHLIDVSNQVSIDLYDLEQEIKHLETNTYSFLVSDLKDEFEYIKATISFLFQYFEKTVKYTEIYNNDLQGEEITSFLYNNELDSTFIYNQIRINSKELKKLKKERRINNE